MYNERIENLTTKQELSCITVIPIVKYMESLYSTEKASQIIEAVGLPMSFIMDKNNWVSYEYYVSLLNKLIEVTQDDTLPYKVAFAVKPQNIFEFVEFSAYSIFWTKSPKIIYKIGLNKKFYRRWTKIEDYEIIDYKSNSIVLKHTMVEGYKHNRANSLSLQGFMAANPISMGLPPAKVKLIKGDLDGEGACIYEITWENKKNYESFVFLALAVVILFVDIFVLRKFLNSRMISVITILSYFAIFFLIQSYRNWRIFRINQNVTARQNISLISEMERREKNYNEIIYTKKILEEKTLFLGMINQIIGIITNATYFTPLLKSILKIITNSLHFNKTAFFQVDKDRKGYKPLFMFNNGHEVDRQLEDVKKMFVTNEEFSSMTNYGYEIDWTEWVEKFNFQSEEFINYLEVADGGVVYYLPVIVEELYSGFFIFCNDKKLSYSNGVIFTLFDNIKNQLKMGFLKITSRNMIENILSSIPAHVVIFSIDNYKVRYINSTFQDLFPELRGRVSNSEELAGQDIFSIIPFNDEAKHYIIQALNRQHVTLSLDDRELEESNKFETNFGNMIVEYSLFPIPQYKNSEKLVGLIMNDISEAKHFQQKLLINEKLLALGKVASGIAHEINNPLYAVLANAEEIVDDEENSEESRELADEIVEHVMTVSNVIKDLSAYSKTLRNDDYDDVDLNIVIEESLKLVRYGTNFLGVNVDTNLNYLPTIKATKGELQQIFINLFNNGIHAMKGKGALKVSTNYNGNFITVNVSDSGEGIPKENLSRIFDLFFTTKRKGTGTGQGLHIVNKIVRRYNGTISVDSELGVGTTFTVNFEVK